MKLLRSLLVGVLALMAVEAHANHVLGGNITWQCLGGNQYQFTLTIYKDCFGATPALPVETAFLVPSGCGLLPFSFGMNLVSVTEISDLCPTELVNSSCNGGIIPGTQQVVYTGTVTLDPTCTWTSFWNGGDWNYFNNIDYSGLPDAFISCQINPAAGCLNSIVITNAPIPYECRNTGVINNALTVSGSGGYTLTYSIATPQTILDDQDIFNTIANNPGYAPINALSVNGAGVVSFNSAGLFVGNYLATICILIEQGGVYVGTIYQNMTFVIRDCTSTPTTFDNPPITTLDAPAILAGPTSIDICAGDPLCFTVTASNTNPFRTVLLTATWDAALDPGTPVFATGATLNPAAGEFCMATTQAMVGGPFNIHFEATDDACVLPGFDDLDITVNIYPSITLSVTDTLICAGQPVTVIATGGANFTWSVLSGDATPGFDGTGGTQLLEAIGSDTEIEAVLNGVPAQCAARDTLTVQVALSSVTFVATNETCLQNNGAINLTVVGGSGNYTYNWNSGAFATQDLTNLPDAQYCVIVTETAIPSCTANVCATIANAPAPNGSIAVQGGVTTLCQGAQAVIVFTGTGDNTQPYVLTVTGSGATVPASINHNGTFTVNPPVGTTTYTLTGISYLNPPACPTVVNSSVTFTVRPLVTASFDPAGPICVGSNLPLTVQINQLGNYNVTFTANPVDPPAAPNAAANPWTDNQVITFNPAATTTYTITNVEYTNAPACANAQNNAVSVTVNPLPTANLTGGTSICAGGCTNLNIALTGTAPWTLNYTINGVAQAALNVAASPFVWNVCPLVTSAYCISSVIDATGCSQSYPNECETVTISPAPTATMAGGGTGCAGSTVNVTVAFTGTGPFTFVHSIGGVNQAAITTPNNPFTLAASVAGAYALTSVALSNGCTGAVAGTANVAFNPLPTAALSGATAICAGACANLTITLTGTGPWVVTFTANGGANINLPVATSPFVWNLCPVATTAYCITSVTAANSCVQNYPNLCQTITVNPLPSASIAGSGAVCAGGTYNFPVTFTGASPWSYTMTTPGAIDVPVGPPGVTSPNNFPATTAGNYFVTSVSDANGCTTITNSATVTLTVNPLPTATIAGNGIICAGGSHNFPVSFTGSSPWTYTMTTPGVPANVVVGPPGVTSPNNFPATVAGNYFVTSVTDNNGCTNTTDSPSATLTVNPLPTAALSGATAICIGVCANLTLTLTGTGPWNIVYTANGGANQNLPAIAASPFAWSLCPLTTTAYCIVSVTDANGCVQNYPNLCQTITVNPLPTASIVGNGAVCVGSTFNFAVTLTGASPWTYTMTTPGAVDVPVGPPAVTSPNNFSATAAGNYFVTTVADANGCTNNTDSPAVTLTVNPLPTATINGNGIICAGGSHNFPVSFTGSSPWTYTMTTPGIPANVVVGPPGVISPNNFPATVAGNYFVTSVTDNNGCTNTTDSPVATLTVNPLPTAALAGATSICVGACTDLSITLTGTGPWSLVYTANGGANQNLPAIAASPFVWNLCPLSSTTYCIVSVIDANGCVQNYPNLCQTITVNPLPAAAWTSANSAYCAGGSVNVTFTLTGTTDWDVDYTIDGAVNSINAIATSPHTFSASAPGSYCLTEITDANGCVGTQNACITITEVPVPVADAGADLGTCINVPVILGAAAIAGTTYSWNNGALLDNDAIAQPTATIGAGGVNVFTLTSTITASGIACTATDDVEVAVNAPPTISIIADDSAVCFGETITLTASGAGAGGTYEWLSDLTMITGTANTAVTTVIPLGTVTFEVEGTDANGCISTSTIDLVAGDPLVLDEVFTANQCFGECEGSISLTPSGGFAPYTIVWGAAVPDPAGFEQDGLCPLTYPYTVTDDEGCNTTADNLQIIINALPENFIDNVIFTPPLCSYDATGQIEIVEPNALEYTIYNCPELGYETQATGVFTGLLAADCYDLYVVDEFGCEIELLAQALTSVSTPLTVSADPFATIFCFQDVIQFTGTGQGGFGNIEIEWYDCPEAQGCLVGTGTPFDFTIIEDITLYAVLVDENGCRSGIDSTSAELSEPIQLTLQGGIGETTLCTGQCLDLTTETSGGGPNLAVQWFEVPATINDPTIGPDGPVLNVCPDVTTEYYAYAADGCNTPAYDTLLITVFVTPEVIFTVDTLSGCFPLEVTFVNETDPTLTDSCNWDFGNGVDLGICGEVIYTYPSNGSFLPILTVTSPDGCVASDTLDTAIQVFGYPEVDFTWDPLDVNVLETEVQFFNLTEGGETYDWSFATFGTSEEEDPFFTFPDIDLAVFQVCLEATNTDGCSAELCRDLVIESILQVWVPNAFTPDQDGVNEVFRPIVKGYNPDSYHLYVYNRWGTLVFESTDPKQAWTGNVYGGEFYSQTDSFVWRIEVERLSDGIFQVFEGIVTMIR